LHHEQDEWFYVVEGAYMIEVGEERYELGPGDSVFAPRKVVHVWAYVGQETGRLIVALQPAGEIEEFFEDLAKLGTSPEREELQRAFSSHSMELAGPPLSIE
jgi:quercetin dioxygenase-like cupin family protein